MNIMKTKIITFFSILGFCSILQANYSTNLAASAISNISNRVSSCIIYTTIIISDENGNVLSQDTFRTNGSGFACIGADSNGIVRKTVRERVAGINP